MNSFFLPEAGLVRAHRPVQLQMAGLVEDVIANGGILVVQAFTGTGKTFAYGVPSVLSDKRVIISTAKKTLQHQIKDKDLPRLTQFVRSREFALLKGKGNYVCRERATEFVEDLQAQKYFKPSDVNRFEAWLETTTTGDLEEDEHYPFTAAVNVTECLRRSCPSFGNCHYLKQKDSFLKAGVCLVNHALLAHEVRMGLPGKLLGPYDVLIVDEAQHLVKSVQEALAYELSDYVPGRITKAHQGVFGLKLPDEIESSFRQLFDELSQHQDGIVDGLDPAVGQPCMHAATALQHAIGELINYLKPYLDMEKAAFEEVAVNIDRTMNLSYEEAREVIRGVHAASVMNRTLSALRYTVGMNADEARLDDLMEQGIITEAQANGYRSKAQSTEYVCHVKKNRSRGKETTTLRVDPVDVGIHLGTFLKMVPTVVLTSATLAIADDFSYILGQFGLTKEDTKHTVSLAPVFDYRRQSCVYIDDSLPKPDYSNSTAKEAGFDALAASIEGLIQQSKGGAFILVPSWTDLYAIRNRLERSSGTPHYNLMIQSESVARDVEMFRSGMHNVLLGTKSLWEGVDIPGMALRLVIITRLPFPPFGDAVINRQKERIADAWMDRGKDAKTASMIAFDRVCVNAVANDLAQAAGRLLRSETDRGVIAILDPRLGFIRGKAGPYATKLRKMFPTVPTSDRSVIMQILANHLGFLPKAF